MTTPILSGAYGYNNTAQRWYDTNTGRFVSEQAVTDEMRRHQEATYNVLDNLTRQLYSGGITLEQWQIGVAAELKDAHLAQALYAVGGKNNATQANYGRVGGALADEYRYLANFANDIAAGRVSEAQALARIRQYGNATQASYWREWSRLRRDIYWRRNAGESCGGCIDMESKSPYNERNPLTKYPGSGDTECRGNCNCTLHEEDVPIIPLPNEDIAA